MAKLGSPAEEYLPLTTVMEILKSLSIKEGNDQSDGAENSASMNDLYVRFDKEEEIPKVKHNQSIIIYIALDIPDRQVYTVRLSSRVSLPVYSNHQLAARRWQWSSCTN